jgi:hypothetical protein
MQTLTAFVHEGGQGKSPVVLALAGLDSTRDLIDKLRTYFRRSDTYELRYLTEAETIEAIRGPIVDQGQNIDEKALQLLAIESAGYPFFIQAYASAAWAHHRESRITLTDVDNTLPDVRARHEISSYQRPLAKLTPRELALAIVLAELGQGRHTWGDVARRLGLQAKDISSARNALEAKGIIAFPIPGQVQFAVPYMDRYLRNHVEHYRDQDVQLALEQMQRPAPNNGGLRRR